jgi:hypothetical protein
MISRASLGVIHWKPKLIFIPPSSNVKPWLKSVLNENKNISK